MLLLSRTVRTALRREPFLGLLHAPLKRLSSSSATTQPALASLLRLPSLDTKENLVDVLVARGLCKDLTNETELRALLDGRPVGGVGGGKSSSGGSSGSGGSEEQTELLAPSAASLASQAAPTAITGYCGFDPTARTLHVGNLIAIMGLVHLFLAGHKPLALVGGATGQVGDPSGRTTERAALELRVLEDNVAGIRSTLERIFDNVRSLVDLSVSSSAASDTNAGSESSPSSSPTPCTLHAPRLVNNMDWYQAMNAVQFVAGIGRFFRLQSMLHKESVKTRMDSAEGMSYTEFSYQIFQAYDFLHLYEQHGCRVQIGGSDQWGNITAGCELIRRVTGGSAYGITLPLLTTSTGEKFGKSAGNAVWLDPTMTSSFELYQFFVRTEDKDVREYLKIFTLLSLRDIDAIMAQHESDRERRSAQHELAQQVVYLIHGEGGLRQAVHVTNVLYGSGDVRLLDPVTIDKVFQEAPSASIGFSVLDGKYSIVDLAADSGLAPSRAEARRLIKSGGVSINGDKVTSMDRTITRDDILHNRFTVLRRGRKNYVVVRWA